VTRRAAVVRGGDGEPPVREQRIGERVDDADEDVADLGVAVRAIPKVEAARRLGAPQAGVEARLHLVER